MYKDIDNTARIADRSLRILEALTAQIQEQRDEFKLNTYYQTYSKSAISNLPMLSRAIVDKAISEMEADGYRFPRKENGKQEVFAIPFEGIIDIYEHRGIPKYRDTHEGGFTIFISNLKGGVSKTVSTVSLAHALRTHPALIKEDLRILVIDLDPQSSATMFLNYTRAIGAVDTTAAQAIIADISREDLKKYFICNSLVSGVDIIPASIEDAFIASNWQQICEEELPGRSIHKLLRENIIDRLADDYDFVFVDAGPHLDAFLMNSIAAADIMMTPIPPAQVDLHSTLKYMTRIPGLLDLLESTGVERRAKPNIGYMTKLAKKADHEMCHSLAKEIFGGDMLDESLPRLDAFERCGESFDTVTTANPATYPGSKEALKAAKIAIEKLARAVFDRIEFIRKN